MKFARLAVVLLLIFAFGCGHLIVEGKRIDASQRRELIKGQTPVQRVVELLGKPAKIEKLPAGAEKYIYQYYKEEYTHWWTLPKYERQNLEVEIKDGIVQDYTFRQESRDVITEKDE